MNLRAVSFFCVFGVLSAVAAARTPDQPDAFGTDDQAITVIGYQDFFPDYSHEYYTGDGERGSEFYPLNAGIGMIPNGAVLDQVVFYVRDDDAAEDLEARLCRTYVDSGSGAGNALVICLGPSASTNGTPGPTFLILTPDLPILYRDNVVGDADPEVVNYFLRVNTRGQTRIRMARLRWRRQVSPAPAEATFTDVPTNHPFFQFVEALANSGITAGCGGGNYCPDAPLTRGQMAVFLAKALGLHWPWDAP